MLTLEKVEGNWSWNYASRCEDVCLPLKAPGSSAAAGLGSEGVFCLKVDLQCQS